MSKETNFQSMKKVFLIISIFNSISTFGQQTLPIIKAQSKNVSINDGGFLDQNAWSLSPETKPDIYIADRSSKPKWVVFYTDIDSIKVKIKPGSSFDFIILLNEKDTCYTRIVSSKSIKNSMISSENRSDTIPFTLNQFDAIHVKGIINSTDTINLHFDIGTLDFRLTRETLGRYKSQRINQLKLGNLVWNLPNIQTANQTSHGMDGRFGWRVFDDKIIEIDYDNKFIIIYTSLPKKMKGFKKSKIKFIQSLFCIESTIELINKKYKGDFLFDTGSDLTMVINPTWMKNQEFPNTLEVVKKSSFSDGAGKKYETMMVSVPKLSVNTFELKHIPCSILGYEGPSSAPINYFGNALLKRFNTIIDLKKDHIYLKPNSLFNTAFKMPN